MFTHHRKHDMDVILNIGLAREGNSNIGTGTVIREVIGAFGAAAVTFKESDTETTAICCVSFDNGRPMGTFHNTVHHLALLLGQQAIAVWLPDWGHGALIGPQAAKWGKFDPQFFLMPDGTRLSERLPAARAA